MTDAAITFSDLTLGYNSHPAVHHLGGAVRRGSLTAVVGANGSGKSTLLKGIVGVLAPMSGTRTLAPGSRIAYLPQQSELDRTFPARVVDLVSMGLWPRRGLLGRHTAEDRAKVAQALDRVGLGGFDKRAIDTLSGGQLQRALFARVLVQEADIVLLDEPFNAVDAKTVGDLVEVIKGWQAEGLTVMVVVHDLDLVRRHFPDTLLLARGAIAWGPTGETLTVDNLQRARRFDEAWHEDAPWCEPAGADHGHDHDGAAHHHPHGTTLRAHDDHGHEAHDHHAGHSVHDHHGHDHRPSPAAARRAG